FKGYLFALATEPRATNYAHQIAARARDLPMTDREQSQLAALNHLLAGNWTRAAEALDHHSMLWPRDIVALQCGHLMDFFRANARALRDRVARALPAWTEGEPGQSFVLGMHAFGLEECGDYARAEAAGRAAVEADPLDGWAHHAVAHVLEMEGRTADGLAWMEARAPHWSGDDSFFQVHNWWHKALFHLEEDDAPAALALFDGPVSLHAAGTASNLVDGAALLWRVMLAGHEIGDRWGPLAEAWTVHADGTLFPFNDWHAAMAYLGAGRIGEVDAILDRYARAEGSEVADWARAPGRALISGFRAFALGDYMGAVEALAPARHIANRFGGSHAQRDVIDLTLVEAALRAGQADIARSLAHERLALRPHSPVNARFLTRADNHTEH
ncbi:MAG: tetratricopeptide repeat protein, partial [Pseudomonadota bacterium]